MADEVSTADLIVRTNNTDANIAAANTFATWDEMEQLVRFRLDVNLWNGMNEDFQIKAMVAAYNDLIRLSWQSYGAGAQNRDYEFPVFVATNNPPLDDSEFVRIVKEAQAAQVMFILGGTQVRDMARDGVRLHRALTGVEMEFVGYKGAVCGEAKEILAQYINIQPRMRRMG